MMDADLNGSLNIVRKAVGEKTFVNYSIEASVSVESFDRTLRELAGKFA